MKIKTAGALLALCITGIFSMHAGAEAIDSKFADAGTVKLTADSEISSVIQIKDDMDVTLDLNGHTLTPGNGAGFYVDGARFTITDSTGGGTIEFANEPYWANDALGTQISKSIVAVNSTLTISNANIRHSYEGDAYEHKLIDANNSIVYLNNSHLSSTESSSMQIGLNADCASDVTITDSDIIVNSIGINTNNSNITINGNSKITANAFGLNIASDPGNEYKFLMKSGTVEAPLCCIGVPDAKITGGTISSYIMVSDILNHEKKVLTISGGTISGDLLQAADYSEIIITGGTINAPLEKGENASISISGGTFANEPAAEYLADGLSAEQDENGNFVVKNSTAKLATSPAVTAQGINNTVATGFVTTISGVDNISSISWAVTGNGATKSTETFDINNVGGNGDVKIGLIVTGLEDSAAVAKATVNGTINE